MNLRNLVGAALAAAIILGLIFPAPILAFFQLLLVLVLVYIVRDRLAGGLQGLGRVLAIGGAIATSVVVLWVFRIVAWRVVRVSPASSKTSWEGAGGGIGVLLGKEAPSDALIWEILFAVVAIGFLADYTREKLRIPITGGIRGMIVGVVLVAALTAFTVRLRFPDEWKRARNFVSCMAGNKEACAAKDDDSAAPPQPGATPGPAARPGGPTASASPSHPQLELACGSGTDTRLQKLYNQGFRTVALTIKGDGTCSTPKLVRPGSRATWHGFSEGFAERELSRSVRIIRVSRDGTREEKIYDEPGVWVPATEDVATGFIYQPLDGEPVTVLIDLGNEHG